MKIFKVGGVVRDYLLSIPAKDTDFVVVGSTPEQMIELGFTPVGSDFPVFLHPVTKDEYALARTERKNGKGYTGFICYSAPDVTLEQDLSRRDLTINAMAMSESGYIIDPYGGRKDLFSKVLRHVGPSFKEDPLRILRLARFAARYSDFTVDPTTISLCKELVASGELDYLVAERVWKEISRGLMEKKPSRMFEVLHTVGALSKLLPEVDKLIGIPQPIMHHPEGDVWNHVMMALDLAAKENASLEVRFAILMHDLGKGVTEPSEYPKHHGHEESGVPLVKMVCDRVKVPSTCRELAIISTSNHGVIHSAMNLKASTIVSLFKKVDVYRKQDRFFELLDVCSFDARGRKDRESDAYPQNDYLLTAFNAVKTVDSGEIAIKCSNKQMIPARIHEARVSAVKKAIKAKVW